MTPIAPTALETHVRLLRRGLRSALALAALALFTTATVVLAPAADSAGAAEPANPAGLIYVSRVSAQAEPSILPSGGGATLALEVRNLSARKISGTVDFWISTPWGTRLSALPTARVEDLAPGETRKLTAHLDGPGQWTFTTAHAVFTPPAKVDKLEARPQARQEFLLVPPFFALAALAVLLLAVAVIRAAARRHRADHRDAESIPELAVTA